MGYQVYIPVNAFSKLPQIENLIHLHLSFVVREFSQTLYGFLSQKERDLFEALLDVSGVGPKLALSIVGHLSMSELHQALTSKDIPRLIKVPGIGKKTAERLIVELRDKAATLFPITPEEFTISVPSDPKNETIRDALSALINLGYNQAAAQKAIKKTLDNLPENPDLGMVITNALKHV
jgi:Holliday junction DNA helicase RuvA